LKDRDSVEFYETPVLPQNKPGQFAHYIKRRGGISHLHRIAGLAALYQVRTGCPSPIRFHRVNNCSVSCGHVPPRSWALFRAFDIACADIEVAHRLAPPRHPQTNGMVERFNGRISELLQQTRFDSAADLEKTLLNYLKLYNHHVPQRAPLTARRRSSRSRNGSRKSLSYSSSAFMTGRDLTVIQSRGWWCQLLVEQVSPIIAQG
jgi:hypothetical protein